MNTMKKTAAGAVLAGALLAAGGLGLAHAAPPAQSVVSDGNVNVTVTAGGQQVGVIRDVSLASAQALAASACPTAGITPEAFQALGQRHRGARDLREPWQRSDLHVRSERPGCGERSG